ncbi:MULTISPECIES: dihydrofolate reductase [unclassified Polynucleobacter]|jgi:dihydrofolate reductase|uniref:dihydrofolate reductase n=1 Tax=unclassified Polynucleobacter TaxID=2640945 RepID=UPI00092BCB9A|nr:MULTISPECIES: dihydrofolate reductase [unclassified Polynucleobacter]MEA9567285.1 dihydrofolate reductase [Polynucleobacter sp. AP-Nickl1-40-C4]OJI05111.1 diacylglycerol kinase [Polynucleobacter sp. MWH-Adler-W8]
MTQPAISMIVARSRNHVIGRDNQMPWKISADLQFFKRVTMGHPVIMGRKTWESIGRPLPGRRNIVVSRNASYQATGGELVGSLDEALKSLSEFPRVFVIGGEQLFTQAFPKADRLYITEIDIDIEGGDTFFEVPNESDWKEVERTPGSEGDVNFSFITLERK